MQKIAIFGKGGIGKSTLAANLAAVYARQKKKVLLVGCDPKHDTTLALTEGRPLRTVVEQSVFMDSGGADLSQVLVRGRLGVDCIEAGGPEPGIGCAGRGISRMIELLEEAGVLRDGKHDVVLFDVLGDVVCGGFAAPLRQGFAEKVVIVASEELMALYAANNIARAIKNYSDNGVALAGLVANLRDPGADHDMLRRFSSLLGTEALAFFNREPAVREAEYRRVTVVEHAPESEMAVNIVSLAKRLLAFDRRKAAAPTPLPDETFHELSRKSFSGTARPRSAVVAPPPRKAPVQNTKTAFAPEDPPGQDPKKILAPGIDFEKAVAWQATPWEGNPGVNSQVWGDPDQWRRFFCDFETRRTARTHLEISAPVINVYHQDLECSYATPDYFDTSLPSFFKFPWPRGADAAPEEGGEERKTGKGRSKNGRPSRSENAVEFEGMTNLKDLDIIHGGGRKLDKVLGEAVRYAQGRASAVIVHSTCIPTVIGDDAESVVARWAKRSKVPVLYSNTAEHSEGLDIGLAVFKKMLKGPSFTKVPRHRMAVNLVGFPEGPGLQELVRLLIGAGITINTRVMPRLNLEEAKHYLAAPIQLFYPNAAFEATYRELFEPLPIRSLRLEAPYGIQGTMRWLKKLASEFGVQPRMGANFKKAFTPIADAWNAARQEASGKGLAFVVDAIHAKRFSDPAQMWGIPVLRVLKEMGFGVNILCHGSSRKRREGLSFFRTQKELAALLSKGRFQAVYSEYAFDARLAEAGKAQFSLDCFEIGLSGALRTLERLNTICGWPFYRRYARYLQEEK